MNNIQQYIDLIKKKKENALLWSKRLEKIGLDPCKHKERHKAFSFCIKKAELLLKNDESNQPQPPDFANTELGEVPPGMDAQQGENSKAVVGETRLVGQNEQTKELCQCGLYHNACECWEYNECSNCGKPLY